MVSTPQNTTALRPIWQFAVDRLETGLLEPAEKVGRSAGGGLPIEFTADQAERARVLRVLHREGISLGRLARANLTVDGGEAFVIFDGHELRACRDATAAIATVVRSKRSCTVVDLRALEHIGDGTGGSVGRAGYTEPVRRQAEMVTQASGGDGAVRELLDAILFGPAKPRAASSVRQ